MLTMKPEQAALLSCALNDIMRPLVCPDEMKKDLDDLVRYGLVVIHQKTGRYMLATPENKQEVFFQNVHDHLVSMSAQICADNNCDELDHNCESYAYFRRDDDGNPYLVDVCAPDFVQDHNGLVALPLPRDEDSNGLELKDELKELFANMDAETFAQSDEGKQIIDDIFGS